MLSNVFSEYERDMFKSAKYALLLHLSFNLLSTNLPSYQEIVIQSKLRHIFCEIQIMRLLN